jgi:hypothetical protein
MKSQTFHKSSVYSLIRATLINHKQNDYAIFIFANYGSAGLTMRG